MTIETFSRRVYDGGDCCALERATKKILHENVNMPRRKWGERVWRVFAEGRNECRSEITKNTL